MRRLLKIMNYAAQFMALIDIGKTIKRWATKNDTTSDKPANPSFRNFTVRRTIEIHLTTINPQFTQRDAEFYVDGNFYVRGQLDGKYQDFYLTRVKMNYNNHKNSIDNGKD